MTCPIVGRLCTLDSFVRYIALIGVRNVAVMVDVFTAAEQWHGSPHCWQCKEETVGEVQ